MSKNLNKLLIFVKAPVLGEVKTRMQPDYSVEQSLKLHNKMALRTLQFANNLQNIDIVLCCMPSRQHTFFLQCENKFNISLEDQQGVDLGERMAFAFSVSLQTHEKVVLIGTDCPEMDEHYINQAMLALDKFDVVIGPAADGGYVLLGLKRFAPELFRKISWGSDTVLKQTQNTLRILDWQWHELEMKHDIDRPEDLYRFKDLMNEIS